MDKKSIDFGHLSRRDQQILETVADLRDASAQDVLRHCGLDVGLSTVRSFLTRLEERGFIRHVKHGKAHVYRVTAQARRQMLTRAVKSVVSIAGSPANAAAIFLHGAARDLSASDVAELRRLLESLESKEANDG